MSRKHSGNILSTIRPTISASSASGIWSLSEHAANVKNGVWPGVDAGIIWSNLVLNSVSGNSGPAYPGTQQQYESVSGTVIPLASNYAFNSGYHYFDIGTGTYSVSIQGAEGSGAQHGFGAIISATMVVSQPTRLVAIVGNPGAGNYTGGGMSAIALRNTGSDIYTSAVPVLVAGGGAGGYIYFHSELDAGGVNWTSTTRRGQSTDRGDGRGGVYDGGAAFNDVYTPEIYANTEGGQGSVAAQHWVWGSRGGIQPACGTDVSRQGGFGGGGGSCPAGGGGYYGGKAGGNNPTHYGGGGGTSYRATSGTVYISAWSDAGVNGNDRSSNPGTARGQISITAV